MIGFDDLSEGAEVTTQYLPQGVEFGEPGNFGLPETGLQELLVRAQGDGLVGPGQASSPPNDFTQQQIADLRRTAGQPRLTNTATSKRALKNRRRVLTRARTVSCRFPRRRRT